jgi:Peptidase family M23
MTAVFRTPKRVLLIALCMSVVAMLVTSAIPALAADVCARSGKPVTDGTFTETSGFGPRGNTIHQGIDLAGKDGTDIFAVMDGTVVVAGPASGFGQWIFVDSQTRTGLVSTVYGHMFPDGVLGGQMSAPGPGSQWDQWRADGAMITAKMYFLADETPPNSDDVAHRVVVVVQSATTSDNRLIDEIRHTAWVTANKADNRWRVTNIRF